MRKTHILILLLAVLSVPCHAITDQERTVLLRLHVELGAMVTILDEAEQASDLSDRRQLNYQHLQADLKKIQQGILDAVNQLRREPRSLPPIKGDYR